MWTLARYLPMMLGNVVPEENEHWETYLTLLDILDICLAPVVTKDMATHLKLLITDHHQSFKECYREEHTFIPKQHYMVHYPEWIKRYVYVWVLSYTHVINACSIYVRT